MAKGSQVELAKASEEEARAPTHVVRRAIQGDGMHRPGDLVLADEWANVESMERNGYIERLFDHATASARQRVRAEIRLRELDEIEARSLARIEEIASEAAALSDRVNELRRIENERILIEDRIKDLNRELVHLRSGMDKLPARRGRQNAILERAGRTGSALARCSRGDGKESGR